MKGKDIANQDDQMKQIIEKNIEIIHALKNLNRKIIIDEKMNSNKKNEQLDTDLNNPEKLS